MSLELSDGFIRFKGVYHLNGFSPFPRRTIRQGIVSLAFAFGGFVRMRRFLLKAVVCVSALLGFVSAEKAQAGLLPTVVTITPDAGNFRWTYAIVLPTDTLLKSGDYFTIYDIEGMIGGSIVTPSGDWSSAVNASGVTPAGLLPVDSAGLDNITFTYSGTDLTGQQGLGNFSFISTYGDSKESHFTARTHRTSDGLPDSNITDTITPTGDEQPPPVPEPATLTLLGLGLPMIGLAGYLRRRKA
jgi:hypothetical protein